MTEDTFTHIIFSLGQATGDISKAKAELPEGEIKAKLLLTQRMLLDIANDMIRNYKSYVQEPDK